MSLEVSLDSTYAMHVAMRVIISATSLPSNSPALSSLSCALLALLSTDEQEATSSFVFTSALAAGKARAWNEGCASPKAAAKKSPKASPKVAAKKKKEAEKASPAKEGESFAETLEKLFEQARQDFAPAFDETKVDPTKHREIFDALSVLTKSADFKKRNASARDIVLSVSDLYAAAYNYLSCSSWQLQHRGMEKALLETASVKVKIAAQQTQGKGNEQNRNGNNGGGSASGTSTVHNISDATVNFCKVSTYDTHTRCFHNITSFAGDAGAAQHCKDRPAAETRASHR